MSDIEARLKAIEESYPYCEAGWCDEFRWLISVVREKESEIARLLLRMDRARRYVGYEGYPCPLCFYKGGVLGERCEMHKQIDAAAEENRQLHEAVRLSRPLEHVTKLLPRDIGDGNVRACVNDCPGCASEAARGKVTG